MYWIDKFNKLRETITIDIELGSIYFQRDTFYLNGKPLVSIHQKKKTNKLMPIPFYSLHQRYTIKNFVQGQLEPAMSGIIRKWRTSLRLKHSVLEEISQLCF